MRYVATMLAGVVMLLGACATEVQQTDLSIGIQAVKDGDLVTAEASFNKVLAKDPNDAFANLNLGLVKAETGRRNEAIGHYQLAAANGEKVPVQELLVPGAPQGKAFDGTVADVARRNLKNLGV